MARKQHTISFGTLVEVKSTGARGFVAILDWCRNGVPLYWLTLDLDHVKYFKGNPELRRRWFRGYAEEDLMVIAFPAADGHPMRRGTVFHLVKSMIESLPPEFTTQDVIQAIAARYPKAGDIKRGSVTSAMSRLRHVHGFIHLVSGGTGTKAGIFRKTGRQHESGN